MPAEDGFPVWRHPHYLEARTDLDHACRQSAFRDRILYHAAPLNPCPLCAQRHSSLPLTPADVRLSDSLHAAFLAADFASSCWADLLLRLEPSPVHGWFHTVPLELYSRAYVRLFDAASLRHWEDFLAVCSLPARKREFFRAVLDGACGEATRNQRVAGLLFRTATLLLARFGPESVYGRVLRDELAPGLKTACLASLSASADARALYGAL